MTKSLLKKTAVAGFLVMLAVGPVMAQSLQFFRSDRVLGYDTDIWRVWAPAGRVEVVVDAGSQTDIDLEVRDDNSGRLLASDDDGTSYCIGNFYHRTAGYVEIRIQNLGGSSNAYTLEVSY